MNTMAPVRPSELQARRARLSPGPAAAAEARGQVRGAIRAWHIPVDPDIAVLLTSDLVTDAIRREAGEAITLTIRCAAGQLRVDVHGTSCAPRAAAGPVAGAQVPPGLALVAALSAAWGGYRTPAGQAVYFALPFRPGRQAPR